MPDLPARIGPVEFGQLGMVAIRCLRDLDYVSRPVRRIVLLG